MKKIAVIAGNHVVNNDGFEFEIKALNHSLYNFDFDNRHQMILFFDQYKTGLPDVISDPHTHSLRPTNLLLSKYKLPDFVPENSLMIFENSLRNYSRGKKGTKNTCLTPQMYKEGNDIVVCNCLGVFVSLLEILYEKYEKVIWIEEKLSKRVKVADVLKAKMIFPDVELIWI